MVLLDPTTAKPSLDQVKDLSALRTLADVELGNPLPTGTGSFVPTDGDVKTSFSVDEAG